MFFKNVRAFTLTKPFSLSSEELETALTEKPFSPCGKTEQSKSGWISPLGKNGKMLTHTVGDHTMICLKKQVRVLPPAVVNDAVTEKVDEIEYRESRKVTRSEKIVIKDEMILTLLPKAFVRNKVTFAYISPVDGLIVVNSSGGDGANELLSTLRDATESLPVIPMMPSNDPGTLMTEWIRNEKAEDDFSIGDACAMYDPAVIKNTVLCKVQDLGSDEIKANLASGKMVKRLGVLWNEALSCSLSDDFSMQQLKFEDIVFEKADNADSAAEQFDQDFAVMTLELSVFFKALVKAFGGPIKDVIREAA